MPCRCTVVFVRQIFGEKEVYLAPMAVLHALLLHRRNFSSAAFANDMFWSHVDLSSSIEQFRIIMLLCQRFKGTTAPLPCSALARYRRVAPMMRFALNL